MCGIAGFCGFTQDNHSEIQKMCDRIRHRGPDAAGYWFDDNLGIALGHRRLSILDLSDAGTQPMISQSERFVISYNGEIYNYKELADRLTVEGFVSGFRSSSDTEVILEAFEAYGIHNALQSMTGMFAIALFDRQTKTLYLTRDRMGEKPLYYGMVNDCFVFASDLDSITSMENFSNAINRDSLAAFLRYKSIPAPLSIYDHIYKLLPGMVLTLKFPYNKPEFSYYWSHKACAMSGLSEPFEGTFQEAKEELRSLLLKSVRHQMVADVPLGAFLSGGIDSPLIVSMMQAQSSSKVKTFTIGFDEKEFNEASYAKDIAMHLGTDHTELYVSEKELLDTVPLLPAIFSEPLADPACFPNYLVSKLARKEVTVTLSGDGGDELFCGYDIYNNIDRLWSKISSLPASLRSTGGKLLHRGPWKQNNKLYTLGEYLSASDIYEFHELFRAEHTYNAYHLVKGTVHHKDYLSSDAFTYDEHLLPHPSDLYQNRLLDMEDSKSIMLLKDQTGFMTDTVLNKVDRTGMYVSLENRIPLLDKDIVEFSWRLPMKFKFSQGINKFILKELLYDYVPRTLLDRPKHGFEVPLASWLSSGPLHDWAEDAVSHSSLVADGLLNFKTLQNVWKTFQAKGKNTLQLWYILQAETWYQAHMNHQ